MAGVRVIFGKTKSGFVVTFYRKENVSAHEAEAGGGRKTTQKIIQAILSDSKITRKALAERTGLTEDGIKYHLNNMRKSGILRRIGPDKGGYWEIIKSK